MNDNLPDMVEVFGTNPRKVFANFYIDDRNAGGLWLPDDEESSPAARHEGDEL